MIMGREHLHGQNHPLAKLTDHEVELIRYLHEHDGWGYRRLARVFEVSKAQIRRICGYKIR